MQITISNKPKPILKPQYDKNPVNVSHEGLLLYGNLVASVRLSGEFPTFSSTAPHRSIEVVVMADGSEVAAQALMDAVQGVRKDALQNDLIIKRCQDGSFTWPSRLGFTDPGEVARKAAASTPGCGRAAQAWMSRY